MTPKQKRAEIAQRWREVEEELVQLNRRKAELTPAEFDRQRVQLVNLRDALERRMSELYTEDERPES